MDRHPGGEAHTRYLISLSRLPPESCWLDFGAGDGEAVRILKHLKYEALGLDLRPRGPDVTKGDFLQTNFESGSFDGILSECAIYLSGNPAGAFQEASRLLRAGGKLVFSDVCFNLSQMLQELKKAGFSVLHTEDLTAQWMEYYLEALWNEESVPCAPKGRHCSYVLLVCERM